MPRFVIVSEEMAGREFAVPSSRGLVGRSSECEIWIEDGCVSSHHAEIRKSGENYILLDLNSTNGTFVNGEQVHEHKLQDGDVVQFGRIECRYDLKPVSTRKPPPPVKTPINLQDNKPQPTSFFQNLAPDTIKKRFWKRTRSKFNL